MTPSLSSPSASRSIATAAHISHTIPITPPDEIHPQAVKDALNGFRAAFQDGKSTPRTIRESFDRVMEVQALDELNVEELLFAAESYSTLYGLPEAPGPAHQLEILARLIAELKTRHLPIGAVPRVDCTSIHYSALSGDLDGATRAIRALFRGPFSGGLKDVPVWVIRAITQAVAANARIQSPKGVVDCLMPPWVALKRHILQFNQGGTKRATLVATDQLRAIAFDCFEGIHDVSAWYCARQNDYHPASLMNIGEMLIHCYTKRDLPKAALVIHDEMEHMGVRITNRARAQVIHSLVKHKDFDVANAVYAKLQEAMAGNYLNPAFLATSIKLFAHQGDIPSTMNAYQELQKLDEVRTEQKTWILLAHALHGQTDRVVELFNELFPDTSPHIHRSLLPSARHYATVAHAFAVVGDLAGVNHWVTKLTQAGFVPTHSVFNDIIKALARRGDVPAVWKVIGQMTDIGVEPDIATYTILITLFGDRRDPINAELMFARAIRSGIQPDRRLAAALMNAHTKSASWSGVIRVFDFIRSSKSLRLYVDADVYNALLKAYVMIGASFDTVSRVFKSFGEAGVAPTLQSYLLLIQSACDAGLTAIARNIFSEMEELAKTSSVPLSSTTYALTMMMGSYLKDGDKIQAKEIYDEMRKRGVLPTAVTYGIIIRAYGNEGTAESLALAEEFLAHLLRPDVSERAWMRAPRQSGSALESVIRPMISAQGKGLNLPQVEHHFRTLLESGDTPSIPALSALMDAYRRGGELESVQLIWERIWATAIAETQYQPFPEEKTGEEDHTKSAEVEALAAASQRSQRSNILCIPLSTYIDALSGAGEHIEIAKTWAKVKEHGFGFDAHNWNHLSVALIRAGEPERAFEVLEKIIIPCQVRSREMITKRNLTPTSILSLTVPDETGELGLHRFNDGLEQGIPPSLRSRRAHFVKGNAMFNQRASEDEDDIAQSLDEIQHISPAWNVWKPHAYTLHILDYALRRLSSGLKVLPATPFSTPEPFDDSASRDEAFSTLERIRTNYPQACALVERARLKNTPQS